MEMLVGINSLAYVSDAKRLWHSLTSSYIHPFMDGAADSIRHPLQEPRATVWKHWKYSEHVAS